MTQRAARLACRNFNHWRAHAPVRCCPTCGDVVNADVPTKSCPTAEHDRRRRERDEYCVDCGFVLRASS
jgi:hypothetical protein